MTYIELHAPNSAFGNPCRGWLRVAPGAQPKFYDERHSGWAALPDGDRLRHDPARVTLHISRTEYLRVKKLYE